MTRMRPQVPLVQSVSTPGVSAPSDHKQEQAEHQYPRCRASVSSVPPPPSLFRETERESKRTVRHHRDRIAAHTRSHGRDGRATNRANALHGSKPPNDNMSERAPCRTDPGRERTARHKQASPARCEAGASARGAKDPHTNEQASTESKGEHASKRENSRRERGRKRRRGGERVRKSRRAIRHHRDRIALHARSHCRTERVTKRPNAPHGPEPLSDNTSKRAPRRTYVRARRESRSKAEGRKREGTRVTPLGAANPSASSSTQLARLTLARSTAIPSLFLIRAHSPFFFLAHSPFFFFPFAIFFFTPVCACVPLS